MNLATLFGFISLSLSGATAALAPSAPDAPQKSPVWRVLILSGEGKHDWRATASFLRDILADAGGFDVKVSAAPAGLTASTLAPFDVVVDDYDGLPLGRGAEDALDSFVASGKGLVVTRAGLASMAHGRAWLGLRTLTKTSWPSSSPESSFRLLELKQMSTEHPILRDLKPHLRTGDQPHGGFLPQAGAEVLAVSDKEEPVLMASVYGKGRVFCTALRRTLAAMQEPAFITTFVRGAEWAAAGKVTRPAEMTMPGARAQGVRVLVITGGHDHEASRGYAPDCKTS
jgi:type 1 glutamine amidotransferase